MAIATAQPLASAPVSARIEYLQRVAALTVGGLGLSALTGILSALVIAMVPALQGRFMSLAIILGSYGIAQYVAPRFVFSGTSSKWTGFVLGATFQGIAMGYLLLAAVVLSQTALGNPLLLVGQALGLTALTSLGMVAYLWTSPRELSMVRAGLSMMFLPMLLLMGISFVFPIGGPIGIAISALFVVISAAGLLYQTNQVLHQLRSDMHVEGAYLITMGVLVLFWNLLSLLMRLTSRD